MVARSVPAWQGKRSERPGEPWQRALQTLLEDPAELASALNLEARTLGLDLHPDFPLRVPRSFLARIAHGQADDPLLRQVLPHLDERTAPADFTTDPLDEHGATLLPGLIRKYPGRVLLMASSHCAIHCRYCFRRHFPYAGIRRTRDDWQQMFTAIRDDASLREVILSGGDPLSLSDRRLRWLVDELAALPQLTRLRIHSRIPVVIPQRITPELIEILASSRLQVSLVIHANHARELDDPVANALAPLRRAGITLLNQSVLLAGVNDEAAVLADLSERLFAIGVMPYYLHLLDRVIGSAHFAVSEERARQLYRQLLMTLPGYLVPRFVRETPHTLSKQPLDCQPPTTAAD